ALHKAPCELCALAPLRGLSHAGRSSRKGAKAQSSQRFFSEHQNANRCKRSNNERGTFTTSLLLPDVKKWQPPHNQRLTIAIASAIVGVCFSYQAAARTGLTSVLINRLASHQRNHRE